MFVKRVCLKVVWRVATSGKEVTRNLEATKVTVAERIGMVCSVNVAALLALALFWLLLLLLFVQQKNLQPCERTRQRWMFIPLVHAQTRRTPVSPHNAHQSLFTCLLWKRSSLSLFVFSEQIFSTAGLSLEIELAFALFVPTFKLGSTVTHTLMH